MAARPGLLGLQRCLSSSLKVGTPQPHLCWPWGFSGGVLSTNSQPIMPHPGRAWNKKHFGRHPMMSLWILDLSSSTVLQTIAFSFLALSQVPQTDYSTSLTLLQLIRSLLDIISSIDTLSSWPRNPPNMFPLFQLPLSANAKVSSAGTDSLRSHDHSLTASVHGISSGNS